jgi:PAS domain-containing protein
LVLSDSELATGFGLILILLLAGLVVVGLRWRNAERSAAAATELSDGAVLISQDGRYVSVNPAAEALLQPAGGPVIGKPLLEMMATFLGPGKEDALDAIVGLKQSGNAIDMLITDTAGQPFELIGQSQGGQLRLVIRDAGLFKAQASPSWARGAVPILDRLA